MLARLFELPTLVSDFVKQPDVLDGYCRLVSEGGNELDLLFAERPHRVAHQSENADRRALAQHRHCNDCAKVSKCRTSERVFRIGAHIRDVNHSALQQCAPGRGPAGERNRMLLHESHEFAGVLVAGGKPQQIAVGPHYGAHIRLAKPGRRLDQRVKYRLQVEGRAADHLENIGGRRLLLQGFAQLIEQARVLDGNNGLGGKILHQLDLLVSEWSHFPAIDAEDTDQLVLLEQRHAKESPRASVLGKRAVRVLRWQVQGPLGGQDSVEGGGGRRRYVRLPFVERDKLRRRVVQGDTAKSNAFAQNHGAETRLADARGILQHRVEHRPQLAW